MLNKQEIQKALQTQRLTSTSDLILFIVGQVNKLSYQDPIEELSIRLNQLEKPKGLDNIMLEQVKTIVQAMLDYREQTILGNVQTLVQDNLTNYEHNIEHKMQQLFIKHMAEKQQIQQQQLNQKYRQPMTQLDSMNLINIDSLSLDNFYNNNNNNINKPRNISEELYSKSNFNSTTALNSKTLSNRNSYQKLTNYQQYQQNQNLFTSKQLSDSKTQKNIHYPSQSTESIFQTTKIKQTLSLQNKQIQDLKHSIFQIQRSITDKLNLQEIHQILSQFQTQIYQNIQNDKIQIQNLQFTLKKQLQSEILNFQKQTFNQLNSQQQLQKSFDQLNKEIILIKKSEQKKSLKYQKLKASVKQLSQNQKNLISSQNIIQKNINSQKSEFQNYYRLNDSKNLDLACLLQQINQKIHYFDKIDSMEQKILEIKQKIGKAQFQTQLKTKNDQIVWQKQSYNFNPSLFKFQAQKSQIIIYEKGIYQLEFILVGQNNVQEMTGYLQIVSGGLNFNKKQMKVISNQNSLRYLVQIEQKSLIALKISSCEIESISRKGFKGVMKISRF